MKQRVSRPSFRIGIDDPPAIRRPTETASRPLIHRLAVNTSAVNEDRPAGQSLNQSFYCLPWLQRPAAKKSDPLAIR